MRYLAGPFLVLLAIQAPTCTQAQELREPPTKSAAFGVGIALANTIVPTVVGTAMLLNDDTQVPGLLFLAYGWFVGPFPGNLYAGDKRRGLIGIGIRAAAFLLPVAVLSGSWDEIGISPTEMAGILTTLGATAWNIWTIPSSVRRYNESLSVGPTIQPEGSFGIRVRLRW